MIDFMLYTEDLVAHQFDENPFISLSSSLEDLNSRLLFLKLVRIPTRNEAILSAANDMIHRWYVPPGQRKRAPTKFYRRFSNSPFRPDLTASYKAASVRNDYRRHKADVIRAVDDFVAQQGIDILLDIARNPNHSDAEKIDDILGFRLDKGIPTKEPTGWDNRGVIILGYSISVETTPEQISKIRRMAGISGSQ